MSSPHLLLRRAAVSCLRQLVQREAREVSDYALSLASPSTGGKDKYSVNSKTSSNSKSGTNGGTGSLLENHGIEGALFSLLDKESDKQHVSNIQDTLVSMLQALAASTLTRWLTMLKEILQTSAGNCMSLFLMVNIYSTL